MVPRFMRRTIHFSVILSASAVLAGGGAGAGAARAATITPTTHGDVVDGNDGQCSLREAVAAANGDAASGGAAGECPAGSGADTIALAGAYTLTGGALRLTSDMTLTGDGARTTTLDAGGADRVLQVDAGATVVVTDVTITGGAAPDGTTGVAGGDGGGILNAGTLTVRRATVRGNSAGDGGSGGAAGGSGGGIANAASGSLTVAATTFSGNTAGNGSMGATGSMGTIGTPGTPGMCGAPNLPGGPGGVGGPGGPGGAGGAGGSGGAVSSAGTLTLTNVTTSGNATGSGGMGGLGGPGGMGGIGGFGCPMGTMGPTGATGTPGAPGADGRGGAVATTAGNASLMSATLAGDGTGAEVANNGGGALDLHLAAIDGSCAGTIFSSDGVIATGTGCGGTVADPRLGALRDNGGPTDTRLPGAGSPAIDGGAGLGFPTTDQRGVARPSGGIVDVGAVEVVPPAFEFYWGISVNPTDATLNGSVTSLPNAATYHFEYGTTPALGSSTPDAAVPTGDQQVVRAVVTGLTPGTTYFVRLAGSNGDGSGVSTTKTFQTAGGPGVGPAPGTPPGGGGPRPGTGGGGAPRPRAVTLSALKLAKARLRAGAATKLTFKLSAAAKVTFTVERRRRAGKRYKYSSVGTFTAAGKAGANSVRFTGKVRNRKLGAATYRLTARVAGSTTTKSITFTILKR